MASTTNYNWSTPDDTDLVKDGAAAIRTLGSSIDTTTKALNPSTTLGDIEYRSSTANTNTRLGIGTTGQILTVTGGVPVWASPAGGKILQVLQQTYSTATSNGTETYADTGITLDITPSSASSKVLIFVTVAGMYRSANDCSARFQLMRGASSIHEFEKNIMNSGGVANQTGTTVTNYLDSPATTSATTYKVQFRRNPAGGGTININLDSSISTITLMEVGA
jgi:hypothetical protein